MAFVEQRLRENIGFLERELDAMPDVEILSPRDPRRRAGILTFRHHGVDGRALQAALMEARVICSPRGGGVRLAPHYYTPQSVLDLAISKIRHTIQLLNK